MTDPRETPTLRVRTWIAFHSPQSIKNVLLFLMFPWRSLLMNPLQVSAPTLEEQSERDPRPLLITCNHLGFWDPFLIEEFRRRALPGYRLHSLMLESEWKKRRWLSFMGALPFDPKNPISFARLLREVKTRKNDPTPRAYLIFPQGAFQPPHSSGSLRFQTGWLRLLHSLSNGRVLPLGLHYSYGSSPRMTPWIAASSPYEVEPEALTTPGDRVRVTEELEAKTQALLDSVQRENPSLILAARPRA